MPIGCIELNGSRKRSKRSAVPLPVNGLLLRRAASWAMNWHAA